MIGSKPTSTVHKFPWKIPRPRGDGTRAKTGRGVSGSVRVQQHICPVAIFESLPDFPRCPHEQTASQRVGRFQHSGSLGPRSFRLGTGLPRPRTNYSASRFSQIFNPPKAPKMPPGHSDWGLRPFPLKKQPIPPRASRNILSSAQMLRYSSRITQRPYDAPIMRYLDWGPTILPAQQPILTTPSHNL